MNQDKLNKYFASFVFVFSLIIYYLTVAPTVSFWDCGEFIACSYRMAVPHPPGAPLYLLVGRIFSLIPIFTDIAKRVNLISVISSAFTILFLYLIIVLMIKQYLKNVQDGFYRYIPYVSAVIGSLTFAFTTSFWFNAVEAEVYAPSMLFTSLVVWSIMYWNERSEAIGNERYLLVIMYLIGLAIGVHLLNVLALPMVFMIIYYKKYPIEKRTFALLILIGAVLTFMIYPGLVKGIPVIAKVGGFFGLLLSIVILLIILAYTVSNKKNVASLLITSILLIILGYSTYATIYIRSNLDPNIDENDPETIEEFISYMNREQYGEHTFDRRKVMAESPNGKNYSSVWDFFWNYQIQKMYTRYFLWNFMGKDDYGENFSWAKFLGIPLLLGILGVWYHFKKDWKHALAVFVLFFMTGLAVIIYLNQPDPQPRERDYSYVGSFFAFAIWIGIGASAILEWFTENTKDSASRKLVPIGISAILILISPVQVLVKNYHAQDRSGNYVAWDYSYNMLMSCDRDAVMYTNGDNDTFPLWYLQEVEYIRTDLRVANLSLLNTSWYVQQLKYKDPKVPISLSDDEIDNIMPIPWAKQRTIEINVPSRFQKQEYEAYKNSYDLRVNEFESKLTFNLGPKLYNRYLRVQDFMILNTLYANKFRKPLYFAVTVSRDNMMDGLQKYLRMDGLSFRITSIANWSIDPDTLFNNLMNKYQYRNLNNPKVFYNENIIALLQNYRSAFIQLANYYASDGQKEKVKQLINKMNTVMPPTVIPFTSDMLQRWFEAYEYFSGLKNIDSITVDNYTERDLTDLGRVFLNLRGFRAAQKAFEEVLKVNPTNIQAKGFLVDIYGNLALYEKSIDILEEWLKQNPGDKEAQKRLVEYQGKLNIKNRSAK
jgi:tetratricopeptide (TPR) repeat protein